MIGSNDNSGGVVAGALVCGTECSGFESLCFDFFFPLSSRRGAYIAGRPILLLHWYNICAKNS